jgi:hypothetical protein
MGALFIGGLTLPVAARDENDRQWHGHQHGNHCGRDRDKNSGHRILSRQANSDALRKAPLVVLVANYRTGET